MAVTRVFAGTREFLTNNSNDKMHLQRLDGFGSNPWMDNSIAWHKFYTPTM